MNLPEGAFVQGGTCQPDPCLTQKGSILRFAVLTLLFFLMLGGVVFQILFANRPYGIQVSSIVDKLAKKCALKGAGLQRVQLQPELVRTITAPTVPTSGRNGRSSDCDSYERL